MDVHRELESYLCRVAQTGCEMHLKFASGASALMTQDKLIPLRANARQNRILQLFLFEGSLVYFCRGLNDLELVILEFELCPLFE